MYTCIRKCACLFPNWYQLDPDYLGISVLRIGDENQPKSDFVREASNFKNSFPPNPYGGKSTMADSIPRSICRNSRLPDPPREPTPQGGEGQEGLGTAGSCEDDSPSRNRRPRGAQRFGDMHSNRNGRLFDDFELRLA